MMKKYLLIVAALLLLIGLSASYITLCADYSDGYRAGTIVKFSSKGYLFKTNEGQLQLGVSPEIWNFTAENNPDVLKEIEEATEKGYRVKVFYHEKYFQYNWRGDTKYIVYKVEKVQ